MGKLNAAVTYAEHKVSADGDKYWLLPVEYDRAFERYIVYIERRKVRYYTKDALPDVLKHKVAFARVRKYETMGDIEVRNVSEWLWLRATGIARLPETPISTQVCPDTFLIAVTEQEYSDLR